MSNSIHAGNLHIRGALTCEQFTPPAGCIGDEAIKSGDPIDPSKLARREVLFHAQESDATAVAETRPLTVIRGATGTILAAKAGSVAPCTGDATITVDLLVNGASILTAPLVLDNADTARALAAMTVADSDLVQDDFIEVDISVNAGTGTLGEGVSVLLEFEETP